MELENAIYGLIVRTSTTLPSDVELTLSESLKSEEDESVGSGTLKVLLENIKLASEKKVPLCQDTGAITIYVKKPVGENEKEIKLAIFEAVRKATAENILRPNTVDSVSGVNSGDNTGVGMPQVFFEENDSDSIEIALLLKGGGSENVSTQYSLPDKKLNAGRDLEGVRKCALDTVFKAQGNGCPPGVLAVVVGGDRSSGYSQAKKLFFRKIGERNEDKKLAELEEKILSESNELGIGPAGLGGKTTLLDVKVDAVHRIPASFFVTVAYNCWALRRGILSYKDGEATYD